MQDKLLRLNYSQYWLESGVLTENMLTEQIRELDSGQDDNTEHYRYRTLSNYFKSQTSFDTERLLVIFTEFEPIAREEVNHKIEA